MEPEVWKDVSEFPNHFQVSNHGRIKSKARFINRGCKGFCYMEGKILKHRRDRDGYRRINLSIDGTKYFKRMNILVAIEFVPNPENKPIVCHIDNDPANNYYQNLAWGTNGENIKYAFDCGRKVVKSKKIIQMDLQGNEIARFNAIKHVDKIGYNSKTINKAILGQRKTAFGFLWKEIVDI